MNEARDAVHEIVVGIDASAPSRAALAWASEYARSTGSKLRAVHVIRYDAGRPTIWTPGLAPMGFVLDTQEVALIKAEVQRVFDSSDPQPNWTLEFFEGPAGHVLVHEARGARMLVIGTREHKGIDRLLVGSVSHYCLSHSECPVAAIPPGADGQPQGGHEAEKQREDAAASR